MDCFGKRWRWGFHSAVQRLGWQALEGYWQNGISTDRQGQICWLPWWPVWHGSALCSTAERGWCWCHSRQRAMPCREPKYPSSGTAALATLLWAFGAQQRAWAQLSLMELHVYEGVQCPLTLISLSSLVWHKGPAFHHLMYHLWKGTVHLWRCFFGLSIWSLLMVFHACIFVPCLFKIPFDYEK